MEKTQASGFSGSDHLLSEILSVLNRIDGHLQAQQTRVDELDSKISSVTTSVKEAVNTTQSANNSTDRRLKVATTLQPFRERRSSTFPTSPSTRLRGPGLETSGRNGSGQSTSSRSSLSQRVLAGQFNDRYSPRNSLPGKSKIFTSPTPPSNSIPETSSVSRRGTLSSLSPPPMAQNEHIDHAIHNDGLDWYTKFPPPKSWVVTRTQGRDLKVKYGGEDAKNLWKTFVGDSCTIPPDGRVEMTFQQHILERLDETQVVLLLETLRDVSTQLEYRRPGDLKKRGSFKVTDYEFDPNFEESVAEYRVDIPSGRFLDPDRRIKQAASSPSSEDAKTAPWKRIIEIRGLSKKLIDEHETWTKSIDEHETWTGNFRDPWNEALPVVNPICPFLTNRIDETNYSQQGYTGMRTVQEALKHHQQCWRRPPPSDDNLSFHVTFYELVDLTHDDELEGEIWRSGKLHSDNPDELEALYGFRTRRIRESACTIVVVPDPAASQFWTMLYMCPNGFELYDKSNEFEHYDMVLSAIKGRNAGGALEAMVGFSIRMVLQRWEKILEYFTWLLGHRDSLSDPDAHDSLLFDDDSFSRSRRYFWAINYLAELDISISRNIIQLDKFIREDSPNKSLREQLNQLQHLRERILGQRDEAIALRDGLFSASGVMESRASTRLNENIKLLTFVSIFFLPLSFCMSVWSVNNTIFSLKALVIVATLVGLSTYLLVFNLNNVAELCSRVYSKRKLLLIELMQKDRDKKWKETGQKFTGFQPKQEKRKPSEWMLGLFVLHKAFSRFRFTKRLSAEEEQEKIRSSKEGSMPYWPDLPLPEELAQSTDLAKVQSAGAGEVRKKPSIRDRFARLSMVFRRGAFSPGTTANV